jgi:hypothetical protein
MAKNPYMIKGESTAGTASEVPDHAGVDAVL